MLEYSRTVHGIGILPADPLDYKRVVIRPPPPEFSVEVLDPTKQGSHFSYGIRVSPIVRSRGSQSSRSSSSYSEYDVWRLWEDCLVFQETLEEEYDKLSREKVKALKRLRTAKQRHEFLDSPYRLRNAAASFESLPEGPDPREVAIDVHRLVPQLNRKWTVFHVGRDTVKKRGDEFAAMIHALFTPSQDAPVLLQELRNCSSVRDFFGFWRRDKDLLKKAGKDVPRLRHSNHSMLSLSNFTFRSSSTAPSSPAVSVFPRANSPPAFLRHSMFTRTTTDLHEQTMPPGPASAPPAGRQFVPDAAATRKRSGTFQEHRPMATETDPGSIMFTDELLLKDEPGDRSSQRRVSSQYSVPKSPRHLGLPEIQSRTSCASGTRVPYSIPEDEQDRLPKPKARQRSNSQTMPGQRNARIFVPASSTKLGIAEHSPQYARAVDKPPYTGSSSSPATQPTPQPASVLPISPHPSSYSRSASSVPSSAPSTSMNRFSVTSSISSYTQESWRASCHSSEFSFDSESCIDPADLTLSNSPIIPVTPLSEFAEDNHQGPGHKSRASVSSFASFRTEASADGVLPRHLHPRLNSPRVRGSMLPLDDPRQSPIDPISEGGDDFLDAYFADIVEGTRFSMADMDKELPPTFDYRGRKISSSISSVGSGNSIDSAGDPRTPLSPQNDVFVVKAVYNESVIVFRAERTMHLTTIRQRIMDRFSLHENIPLDKDFLLGYLPSKIAANNVGRKGRSNSVNSTASDLAHLQMLQTEVHWRAMVVNSNGKLTLQVLDPETHP